MFSELQVLFFICDLGAGWRMAAGLDFKPKYEDKNYLFLSK
jgi:hypothetical protein